MILVACPYSKHRRSLYIPVEGPWAINAPIVAFTLTPPKPGFERNLSERFECESPPAVCPYPSWFAPRWWKQIWHEAAPRKHSLARSSSEAPFGYAFGVVADWRGCGHVRNAIRFPCALAIGQAFALPIATSSFALISATGCLVGIAGGLEYQMVLRALGCLNLGCQSSCSCAILAPGAQNQFTWMVVYLDVSPLILGAPKPLP